MSGTELPFAPATTSGNDFADFLLGTVGQAQFTQALATWLPRWWSHAFYVQDDVKLFHNVTLNLGLRWSYESPFNTKYGFQSQFDPNAVDPISGRKGAITHPKGPLASKDLNNFQPRVGLAWDMFGSHKNVIRMGAGVFYAENMLRNVTILSQPPSRPKATDLPRTLRIQSWSA